ncbi:MAG: hypothetical protein QM699_12905 [Amaricoccus sp.]|uniref:hypothetical protein n=1 Tax=Amaricoccus sp. TaxID=1872485 RepID=UPI0039E6DBC8
MRFTASLEVFSDASCLGWVHELPGCAARVRHRTEIERALATEIRRFLAEADEPLPRTIEIAIAIEAESSGSGPEATAALIAPDREALDPLAWARIAHRLAGSRERLLDRLDAAGGADPALLDEARHVGLLELLLAGQTFDTTTTDGARSYLAWTRSVTMARLSTAAARDTGQVSGGGDTEAWSAAKVARRLVWHERLHGGE